jgi:hypothetical protein
MKSEIYNALAAMNRSFDVTLESLTILKQEGVLPAEYVQRQTEITEEIRAGLNYAVWEKMEFREQKDWAEYGKMRVEREARLGSS